MNAEQVRVDLEDVVARFAALGSGHRDHVHVLFAELYLCETASWLDHLKPAPEPELAYRVIPRFLALYREHVLDALDQPLREIVPHWRAYHRLSRRLTIQSPISSHLLLISLGAWAHTRFDLGRSICEAGGERGTEGMFGEVSDAAFVHATRGYIDRHLGRQRGWRRLMLTMYRGGIVLLKPVWLREFQRWRSTSYQEYRRVLSASSAGDELQNELARGPDRR